MNTLTAIRTFAKPGFSPAKRTKLFNDRWYIERGQGDYLGLGEGEYTELLPGNKARDRRDAHLNHCNRLAEYDGPVFELMANQYGGELRSFGFYPTIADLTVKLDSAKASHDKWVMDCRTEAAKHMATALELEHGTGKSIMTAEHHRQVSKDCTAVADKHKASFKCDARKVR